MRGDHKRRAACPHLTFVATVNVNRLSEKEGGPVTGFNADVRVRCVDCDAPMRFLGTAFGSSHIEPRVSVDRTELRVPMEVEIVPEVLDRPEDGQVGSA